MNTSRWSWSRILALLILVAVNHGVLAQGSEEVNAGQFDFSLPGARSLGMGGAFVALADDATAAYSNPAGLVLIGRPEISAEFRGWSFASTAIDRGHAFGAATGIGLDTIDGVIEERFESDTSGVSFLSAVYPRERYAVGVFRHVFPRFETRREIDGAFFDCAGGFFDQPDSWDESVSGPWPIGGQLPLCSTFTEETGGIDRIFPKEQDILIDIASVGLTYALKVNRRLSVGVSALYYDFSIDSTNVVFSIRDDVFSAKDPAKFEQTSVQDGDDTAVAVNAGVRWELSDRWFFGAAYREGPEFEFVDTITAGPSFPRQDLCPAGTICDSKRVPFRVPDTYVAGLAYRPIPVLTFMVQYDLVEFTDLLQDFQQTSGLAGEAARVVEEGLTISDAQRFRFGFEYTRLVSGGNVVSFRGGAWHDSDHKAYFKADPATGFPYPREALFFPRGEDATHVTGGIGFTWQPDFQIDIGIDSSSLRDTMSLSAIWKF